MTSSSHISMMWKIWGILFTEKVAFFPTTDKSENTSLFFFYIYEWQVGKEEGKKIHLNICYILSTWESHCLLYFFYQLCEIWSLLYKCKLLMLEKMKYFVYISSKSKNKGCDSSPGCCAPNPCTFLYITLHHDLFSHVEASVGQPLPSLGPLSIRHGCPHPADSEPLSDPHQEIC